MEKSFKLTLNTDAADALRAELHLEQAEGRTVITVAMTVPNQLARMPLAAAQAEVLRLAMEDLHAERQALLSTSSSPVHATRGRTSRQAPPAPNRRPRRASCCSAARASTGPLGSNP